MKVLFARDKNNLRLNKIFNSFEQPNIARFLTILGNSSFHLRYTLYVYLFLCDLLKINLIAE